MSLNTLKKMRLDTLLVTRGLIESREKARALILGGKVVVDGNQAAKAGTFVKTDVAVEILQNMPYVSRGGLKLEAALTHFHIDVKGKVAMDIGASTGGFTDCLLQHGAGKVYAIDVGYGQFDWKLRNNPHVIVLEKTNIRYLGEKVRSQDGAIRFQESAEAGEVSPPRPDASGRGRGGQEIEDLIRRSIDIATVDVSFISLIKVIPKVLEFLKPGGEIVALIKPQFEVGKKDVGKNGVVREEAKRIGVIEKITAEVTRMSLRVNGVMMSPLIGPKGNVEYFIYLDKLC